MGRGRLDLAPLPLGRVSAAEDCRRDLARWLAAHRDSLAYVLAPYRGRLTKAEIAEIQTWAADYFARPPGAQLSSREVGELVRQAQLDPTIGP
jgi:hypothetical protein